MIGRIAPHDKYGRATRGWHAWLYDRMALPDGIRIMELGCGPGKLRGETIAPLSNFLIKEFNHHHGVLRITKDAGLLIACFCRRLPAGSAFGNIFHCVRFGSDKVYCTHSGAAGHSVQRERLGLRCLQTIRHAPTRRRNPAEIRLGGPSRAGVEPPGGGFPALHGVIAPLLPPAVRRFCGQGLHDAVAESASRTEGTLRLAMDATHALDGYGGPRIGRAFSGIRGRFALRGLRRPIRKAR
jgi:hypothetical protein